MRAWESSPPAARSAAGSFCTSGFGCRLATAPGRAAPLHAPERAPEDVIGVDPDHHTPPPAPKIANGLLRSTLAKVASTVTVLPSGTVARSSPAHSFAASSSGAPTNRYF